MPGRQAGAPRPIPPAPPDLERRIAGPGLDVIGSGVPRPLPDALVAAVHRIDYWALVRAGVLSADAPLPSRLGPGSIGAGLRPSGGRDAIERP